MTEGLKPDVLALRAIERAASKVVSWPSGLGKGPAGVGGQRGGAKAVADAVETEVG